jgi:predicted MFS family arabinose efflux permease
LVGGLLIARFGWRFLFLSLGLVSLTWLLPWIWWSAAANREVERKERIRPGTLQILCRRETWGTSMGMFALGYAWTFLISWLPTYLMNERGLSMRSVAVLGSLPFWAMASTSLLGGWWSDRWIASGGGVTRVRKTFLAGGLLLCSATLLPAAVVRSPLICAALLVVSCSALGFFTSNVWAVTQTLAGPLAAGSWTGVQNAVGNLGGVLSPALTGVVVSKTGSYFIPFALSSAVLFVGVLCYFTLVGKICEVRWNDGPIYDGGLKQ